MAHSIMYECDLCGNIKSQSLNDFFEVSVTKYPGKPKTFLLCESHCWKLFRKFWKDVDKELSMQENSVSQSPPVQVSERQQA